VNCRELHTIVHHHACFSYWCIWYMLSHSVFPLDHCISLAISYLFTPVPVKRNLQEWHTHTVFSIHAYKKDAYLPFLKTFAITSSYISDKVALFFLTSAIPIFIKSYSYNLYFGSTHRGTPFVVFVRTGFSFFLQQIIKIFYIHNIVLFHLHPYASVMFRQ